MQTKDGEEGERQKQCDPNIEQETVTNKDEKIGVVQKRSREDQAQEEKEEKDQKQAQEDGKEQDQAQEAEESEEEQEEEDE